MPPNSKGLVNSSSSVRARGRAPRIVAALVVVVGVGGFAFVNAATFLAAPAQVPVRADAAFVLGGDTGDRVLRAAELHRQGLAGVFVLTGMENGIEDALLAYLNWRVKMLERAGVPENVLVLDFKSTNSEEEARYGLKLARERGWKRISVVSDPPHMRRLKLLWGRAFAGSGIEVQLVASQPRWWTPERWWSSRKSAQFVVQEYIKLAYTLF